MNILVSGSNGLLGSTFKLYQNKFNDLNFIFKSHNEFDITNINDIEKNLTKDIDIFINCAAYINADKGENDTTIFNVNYKSIENLAIQCKKNNILFIHFSSDYVFGGDKSTPYNENDNISPLNNYGISKVLGEFTLKNIDCSYIIFRITWLYAEFGKSFVTTIIRLLNEGKQINVVNDQIGTPTYSIDLVNAIIQIIQKLNLNKKYNDVYHFSNEGVCSFYDFAYFINKYYNNDINVIPCSTEEYSRICSYKLAKRPKYSVLDKTKIKNKFDIQIPHWNESLQLCINNIKHSST